MNASSLCYPTPARGPRRSASPQTTRALLRGARSGDPQACAALVARVEPLVRGLVKKRMGGRLRRRAESIDIAQSVLGQVLAGLRHFEPRAEGAFTGWLARLIENRLRKEARRMRYGDRDPARALPLQPSASDPFGLEPVAGEPGPAAALLQDEQRRRVLALVERLPARERALVRLRRLQELDWDEVLRRSGEPNLKAARGAFSRGMARLANWAADLR